MEMLAALKAFFTVDNAKAFSGWAVALLTVGGFYLQGRRERAEIKMKVGAVAESIGARFSISEWKSTLTLGADGSGVVVRMVTGLKTKLTLTDVRVPYRMRTTRGTLGQIQLKSVKGSPGFVKQEYNLHDSDNKATDADIVLNGPLTKDSGSVGFEVTQEVSRNSFCATEQDVRREMVNDRFKYEFFGTTVVLPVDTLEVEVEFPDHSYDARQRAFAVVFYGEQEVRNPDEEERIVKEKAFFAGGNTAQLRVTNAIRGHHYAVAWTPPPTAPVRTA